MGLWSFFHKKKKEEEELHLKEKKFKNFLEHSSKMNSKELIESNWEQEENLDFMNTKSDNQKVNFDSLEERTEYIKSCCERTIEASRQIGHCQPYEGGHSKGQNNHPVRYNRVSDSEWVHAYNN